jgi:hypothetical protein
MINKQIEEEEDEDNTWSQESISHSQQYIKRLEKIDENHPISFPSCNYDTYIRKVGDCYLVATCNNTQWDLWNYTTKLTDTAKEKLKELLNTFPENSREYSRTIDMIDSHYNDEFYAIGKDFYDLNKQVIGVEVYESCPNKDKEDHKDSYYMWDTVQWGKICLICNPYFQRKDKLKEINLAACKK